MGCLFLIQRSQAAQKRLPAAADLTLDKALEIVNYCLTKYEYAVANQPEGKSYYECYDRKTRKPCAEWVDIDNKVREDLRRFGLKI